VSATLDDLRREHAEHVIGDKLADLLERLVRATARTYPAAEYSDAGVWNDASLSDVLHDWVEVRLLRRGDLAKMLAQASSLGALRGALTRSFRQFLANRRERTSSSNLYQRMTKILRDGSPFVAVGASTRSGEQLWALEDRPVDRTPKSLRALVEAAFELDDETLKMIHYRQNSLKSSPILRNPKLREFLIYLLMRAEGALDQATIHQVITRRFNLWVFDSTELELGLTEAEEVDEPDLSQDQRRDIIASVRMRLGKERIDEIHTFARATEEETLKDPKRLPKVVSEALTLIAEYAPTSQEAEAIYDDLVESLF
jgi:hypothetical protein